MEIGNWILIFLPILFNILLTKFKPVFISRRRKAKCFLFYTIIHKCVTAGNTLFPCLNYLSCYPFQKINVEKKKTRKEKPNFQTNKKNKKSWNRAMFWDEMLSRCFRESMSSRILGSRGINLNDIRPPVLTT